MIRVLFTGVLLIFTLAIATHSKADVSIVDGAIAAGGNSSQTSFLIETGGNTGDDKAGDYALIMCSTLSDGSNSFLSPTPGAWTEIDNDQCADGGFGDGISCTQGVFGMFTNTAEVENISCNWTDQTFVYNSGSFRFRNVDVNNPIIASECDTGFSNLAVAPSIESEAGAQVARIVTYRFPEGISCADNDNQVTDYNLTSIFACSNEDVLNISLAAETKFDQTGGPTGEATFPIENFVGSPANWRACTVALRMTTRAIPTMSEWGLLAAVGFMGIAGALYIRRRKLLAN